MPSRTLAATIQSQLGASIIKNGTGRPTAHPNTSVFFRPELSASWPETRFVIYERISPTGSTTAQAAAAEQVRDCNRVGVKKLA